MALEGDKLFRNPDPMAYAAGEGQTIERDYVTLEDEPPRRSLWQRLTRPIRALVKISENAQRLQDMVDELDKGGHLKRFERAARIMENQQNTQRQLVSQVHALEGTLVRALGRAEQQALPRQPAPPAELQVGVSG